MAAATTVAAATIYSGVESEQMVNYVFTDEFNGLTVDYARVW